jgi:CRP-like cAMP-binding protein
MNGENFKETGFARIKNILKEIDFFEEFTDGELDFFSKHLSLRAAPKDTILFKKGDISDYLFFIVEGSVEVRLAATRAKSIIATFSSGHCVGEMSLVDDFTRTATVYVTEPSELLILTKSKLDTIIKDNPICGVKIFKGLAKNLSMRLRSTSGRFADVM